MNVEEVLALAEDHLLGFGNEQDEDGGELYPEEQEQAISALVEQALLEQSNLYERLVQEEQTLEFENDELDVNLEEVEPKWPEERSREMAAQISYHQQENRRLAEQVELKKQRLRDLLLQKSSLSRELEDLRSKEQFFERKSELNRKSIEQSNQRTVKSLAEKLRVQELTKSHEANIDRLRQSLNTLNENHRQKTEELASMQSIFKELTGIYMQRKQQAKANRSGSLLSTHDQLSDRWAKPRPSQHSMNTFRD